MLSTATVITNSCLIGFVGSQVAGFVVAQDISFDGEEIEASQANSFVGRIQMWQMWVVVMLFEHSIFAVKASLSSSAEHEPSYITDARSAMAMRKEGDLASDVNMAAEEEKNKLQRMVSQLERRLEMSKRQTKEAMAGAVASASAVPVSPSLLSTPRMFRGKKKKGTGSPRSTIERERGDDEDDEQTPAPPPRVPDNNEEATTMNPLSTMEAAPTTSPPSPSTMSPAEEEAKEEAKLRLLWDTIDQDGSGLLDMHETRRVMKAMGKEYSDLEFAEKMAEIDLDGSGELDYDEFLDWWQSQDQLAQEQLMKLQALDFRQI